MAENTTGKQRGKPFKPGKSGNPSGRPAGAKNRTTLMAQTLFDGEAEALVRKVIELAMAGDIQALRLCIDRLCPPLKAHAAPIELELPETQNLSEIANAFIRAAANGRLPPDVATQLVQAVGTMARVTEIDELKVRLAALEAAVGNQTR